MNEKEKIDKTKINDYLPEKYAFICFASFEERSLTIPMVLKNDDISISFILRNIEESASFKNEKCLFELKKQLINNEVVELNLESSVSIADKTMLIVKRLIEEDLHSIIIDISTFTHETLLILLKLLYDNIEKFDLIKCIYNGALQYSVGDPPEKMWLSKGCRDIRNVIGYPGLLNPSLKNHLIVLTGYETERATRLIEMLEPDLLSLGDGNEPTEENHDKAMQYFKNKFNIWKDSFQGVISESFTFSCRDVQKTVESITNIINKNREQNYIIVPLNTKISTVAISLVALHNPRIQVCYALPEMYNMENYSEPSNNVTILDMKALFLNIGGTK